MTQAFSDRIEAAITLSKSMLVAGIDPDLAQIPAFFLDQANKNTANNEDFFAQAIFNFYTTVLESIHTQIAAVKPNLAFFERYGLGGMRAYIAITAWCRERNLLIIADAKRGDIGTTATAYAQAYLAPGAFKNRSFSGFEADALTINPFLGFDTLTPFIEVAAKEGKGLFVLARTSNPGSADLQSIIDTQTEHDISAKIADWLQQHAELLMGNCGLSGLGAVVGATHREDLVRMRKHMPHSLFLIPGYGAQGGTAADIAAAVTHDQRGIVVNSSRGIFGTLPAQASLAEISTLIEDRVKQANQELLLAGR
jgi:orotidine-5'-phosphate decarboxylase